MIAVLRGAVDQGVTFFHTVEVYGPYANEEPGPRTALRVHRTAGTWAVDATIGPSGMKTHNGHLGVCLAGRRE